MLGMRAALFLAAALLLLTAAQAADPSVTIGWVYGSPAPPEKSPDGLQTRDYRVQSGLEFWLKRAKSDRKQSALITKAANGDFDAAYAALCTQDQVQYLVGPSSWRGTYEVLTGGNATTACPKEAVWGFLWMDEQLEALANTLGLNWFSLHPRFPNDPLQVYVVSRLLFDQDHYTWSILSQDSVSDPELDRVARFGAAIANMLVTPSAATRNLEFTLFQNATFDLASPTNASVAVNDFVDQLARKRPEVNVLALALSGEDAEFMNFVKQTLFPELDAAGRKEPNPDTVLLLSPVEYYDFTKADRKYIKYWTALAMWDHTFTWKHDSKKSWSMGSPTQYWDDFNDHFDRRPGNWDALATISAVVLDRARTKAGLQNVKLNTFFGPIDFTGVAGNSSLRQADVDKWYAVQFLFGDTSAIGETKAVRKSVDSPGRWKWKSYSLTSSAIAAIVLGVILMIIGLLVAAFAAYKFIGLWLHPPSHSDNEKDDEKEKSD